MVPSEERTTPEGVDIKRVEKRDAESLEIHSCERMWIPSRMAPVPVRHSSDDESNARNENRPFRARDLCYPSSILASCCVSGRPKPTRYKDSRRNFLVVEELLLVR